MIEETTFTQIIHLTVGMVLLFSVPLLDMFMRASERFRHFRQYGGMEVAQCRIATNKEKRISEMKNEYFESIDWVIEKDSEVRRIKVNADFEIKDE